MRFGGLLLQKRLADHSGAINEKEIGRQQLLGKVSDVEERLSLSNLRTKEDFRLRNSAKYNQ